MCSYEGFKFFSFLEVEFLINAFASKAETFYWFFIHSEMQLVFFFKNFGVVWVMLVSSQMYEFWEFLLKLNV